ncbi:hypothetical protein ACHAXH_001021, partial [Discostella pseudostelligera]
MTVGLRPPSSSNSLPFESNDHGQCTRRVHDCRGGREQARGEIRGVTASSAAAVGGLRAYITIQSHTASID